MSAEAEKAHRALLRAAQKVMRGLDGRIRHAKDETPVFVGIAALHDAINVSQRTLRKKANGPTVNSPQ